MDVIFLLTACFGAGVIVGMLLRPRSRRYGDMGQWEKMKKAMEE